MARHPGQPVHDRQLRSPRLSRVAGITRSRTIASVLLLNADGEHDRTDIQRREGERATT